MEIKKTSTEEPVATQRNFPLAICDVDHIYATLFYTTNATRLFRLSQMMIKFMYSGLKTEINKWVSDRHVFSRDGTLRLKRNSLVAIVVKKNVTIFLLTVPKIVSEYDQEIPRSQTTDNPMAPRGRAIQPSWDIMQ